MKEGTDIGCSASTGIWDQQFYVGKRSRKVLNPGSLQYFRKDSLAAFTDNSEYNPGGSVNPAALSRFSNWMFSADQ